MQDSAFTVWPALMLSLYLLLLLGAGRYRWALPRYAMSVGACWWLSGVLGGVVYNSFVLICLLWWAAVVFLVVEYLGRSSGLAWPGLAGGWISLGSVAAVFVGAACFLVDPDLTLASFLAWLPLFSGGHALSSGPLSMVMWLLLGGMWVVTLGELLAAGWVAASPGPLKGELGLGPLQACRRRHAQSVLPMVFVFISGALTMCELLSVVCFNSWLVFWWVFLAGEIYVGLDYLWQQWSAVRALWGLRWVYVLGLWVSVPAFIWMMPTLMAEEDRFHLSGPLVMMDPSEPTWQLLCLHLVVGGILWLVLFCVLALYALWCNKE